MGRVGKTLTLVQIVEINRRMLTTFGGFFVEANDNLLNPDPLHYTLEAIQVPIIAQERYPTPIEKAAALAWCIITHHVFYDGNKRTGMETCRLFLDINGCTLPINRQVVQIALDIATRQITFETFVSWLKERTYSG
jgi:death-on-curing protein